VNGFDSLTSTIGDVTWTWRHRNRLTQTQVTRQDDPSQPAPEGTYTYRVGIGISPDRYVFSKTGLIAGYFRISGPDGSTVLGVTLDNPGDVEQVVLRSNTGAVEIYKSPASPPPDSIPLWSVPVIRGYDAQNNPIGVPGTPTDVRPYSVTTTTGSAIESAGLTAAQRVALTTNGLLQVQFSIKTVNGTKESAERFGTPFVMTGLGMCLGSYLGGIQQ
jgi:hypothetical protein